jgi:hypothetical protein
VNAWPSTEKSPVWESEMPIVMGALVPPLVVLLLLLLQEASASAAAAAAVRAKNRVPWGLIRSSFQFFKWPGGISQPPLAPQEGHPRNEVPKAG